jgi:hypothetical protein
VEGIKHKWYIGGSTNSYSAEFDSAVTRTGRLTLKLSTTDATGKVLAQTASDRAATYVGPQNELIPLKASTKYRLSVYCKTSTATAITA